MTIIIPYKLTKLEENDHIDSALQNVVTKILTETKIIPEANDYDIGQFVKSNLIKPTSPTLLALRAKFISNK